MSKEKEEIKKLAAWCQKARSLLGMGVQGDSSKMEKRIDAVEKMLKSLSEKQGAAEKELFGAAMESFRIVSEHHVQATEAYKLAEQALKSAKKGTEAYERASQALNDAREKVRALMVEMKTLKDDLSADVPLAEALRTFQAAVENGEKLIRNELTQPHADLAQLNDALKLLQRWKGEVDTNPKYRDPKAVRALTMQLSPLLGKLIKAKRQESGDQRKDDRRQSAARGGAEQRLKAVEELFKSLDEAGQLVPALRTQFSDAIRDAKALYVQENWIDGEALLKPLPGRTACLKAFDKARLEAEVDFGPEIQQATIGLAGVREKCDVALIQRQTGALNGLKSRAGAPGRKPKDNAQLLTEFRALIQQLKDDIQYAVTAAGQLGTQLDALNQTATRLTAVVPLNVSDEHQRQIQLIGVLRDQKRWKEALDTARLLQEAMARQDDPAYATWQRVGATLKGRSALRNDIRLAAGNPQATPALRDEAGRLSNRIDPAALERLEQARDWKALVDLQSEVSRFVAGLPGQIEAFKDFSSERQEADGVVQLRLKRAGSEIDELERAIRQAGADPAPVLGPLKKELADLTTEWKRRLDSAASPEALNTAQMEDAINLLGQAVRSANYGPNIDEVAQGQRDAAGRAAFDKAAGAIERDSLVQLDELDTALAERLRREIGTLAADAKRESDPTQPWAARINALQDVATRATQGVDEARNRCEQLNRELAGKAEAVALTLTAAREELKSKGWWASLASRYQPMFDFMHEELEGLRQLLSTPNASAAEGNKLLLQDLKTRADKLVLLAKANKGLDGRETRVENAAGRLESLRKEGLKKALPETDEALGTQLAEIKRDLNGMEPDIVNQVLEEFDQAVRAATTELNAVKQRQQKLKDLEANLRPRIGTLKQSGEAVTYYDTLLERIGAAVKKGGTTGELPSAIVDLEAIGNEVTQAESDPKAALARQKTVNDEKHAGDRLKREYEGRLATVKDKLLERAKKAVGDAGGDKGQIDELERMIKMAMNAAKGGDHERAVQTLVRTENRVAEIEKNPAGTALGDRHALDKHLQTFASQMQTFRDELDAFVEAAVAEVPESARETVRKPLVDAVAKAKTQLNPRVFDPYVPDIGNDKLDKAKRREQRDQALQRLRELRIFISSHPTLAKLALNPIRPLTGPLRLIDTSLNRLDAHLRSAIR